jgi:hypothetical protein
MVNRTNPRTAATSVFTNRELTILNHLAGDARQSAKTSIAHYLNIVAKLGGYLARKADGPPGNLVLWRGLSRLTDIHLGVKIGEQPVDN